MLNATRFVASLAISLWGLGMLVIGLINGVPLWIVLGVVIMGVGLPFFAGLPWAAAWLYPTRGGIERVLPGTKRR